MDNGSWPMTMTWTLSGHGKLIYSLLINGINRLINGISRLSSRINQVINPIIRLIYGWGPGPGPGPAVPNPPTHLHPKAVPGPRLGPRSLISQIMLSID